ncbi:unnamed protein product [Rhizoctonia solani]|uniref:Zn(2)-C6 fungal-type domain-containing protein n=1 Tax=Rhizoctonia solani TaxID=456999 RepID=A0A8H2Y0C5_9AGAM|nr:unnamed protein product [Rhizoctonia solani]
MIPKHRPGPLGKSCLTCKTRHKKCDQRQPVCKRCEEDQFECLGYDHNRATKTNAARLPTTLTEDSSPSTHSTSSGPECLDVNETDSSISGEHFRAGRSEARFDPRQDTPATSSSSESSTGPDLNDGNGDVCHVNPRARRVEDCLYLFATRSTFKVTDSPMSILRKIIHFQEQIPPCPSDPLKHFLNSRWFYNYTLAHSERVSDHWYFKPIHYKRSRSRENIALRLRTSNLNRWIALVGMGVLESLLAGDTSQLSLHGCWLGQIEGLVERELIHGLAPSEIQQRYSDLIYICLLKTIILRSTNLYQVLQGIAPTFLQVIFSNPELWTSGTNFASVSLSRVLASEAYQLALFVLMDCTCAMAFGLPHQVEYDTTIYPRLDLSPSIQWTYGSPIEFQAVLADINNCRDRFPTARDWRDIEQRLLTWQSRPGEHMFTESWMTIAWYAVQESWRLALLVYLYMAVCGISSDDPRIQSRIKQILQVVGTIRKQESSNAHVSFFVQYLMVGICARSEEHREVARDKLLAATGSKTWLMRASDFVPVLDHLWHGVAANGRPVKWSDYMHSRQVVLPVLNDGVTNPSIDTQL